MDATEFDELAGRIDGIGHALLRVVALLEAAQLMDGTRVSDAWRQARPAQLATDAQLRASHQVLNQLADLLDEARQVRARQAAGR